MTAESLPALAPTFSPLPAIAGPDLVAAWLDGRKPSTIAGYRKDLDHFTRFLGTTLDTFLLLHAGQANGVVLAYRNEQPGESVRLAMSALGKAAGLPKPLRPHGLRHSGISKLRSLGESDRDVMALSGHANPQMLGRYDDTKDQGARKMAAKLDAELR